MSHNTLIRVIFFVNPRVNITHINVIIMSIINQWGYTYQFDGIKDGPNQIEAGNMVKFNPSSGSIICYCSAPPQHDNYSIYRILILSFILFVEPSLFFPAVSSIRVAYHFSLVCAHVFPRG